jgi:hypothetical protein
MLHRNPAVMLILVCTMSAACHSLPPNLEPATAAESPAPSVAAQSPVTSNAAPPRAEDVAKIEPEQMRPCVTLEDTGRAAPKRKPKPVVHVQTAPQVPIAVPPPKVVTEAEVNVVSAPESSILGRKVRGPQGDDLGRVVDVLADAQGRVRVAIIEFGGFLGVGNRRIAVDWSLLKFHRHDPDAPVVLEVTRDKLQEAPEYKGSERPLALMAPETKVPRPNIPN